MYYSRLIVIMITMLSMNLFKGLKISPFTRKWGVYQTQFRTTRSLYSTAKSLGSQPSDKSSDVLMTGLNGAQDISVKVVSCRDIIQEVLRRNTLTPVAGKHLGELLACSLMMGDGLKGQESLQINLVGSYGLGNMMAITNGELNIRGMVGNPLFSLPNGNEDVNKQLPVSEILGEGEIQIVRSHPAWKHPMNGITALRNTTIPINLALYMAESEQRTAALIADVRIENGQCVSALGVMVETLPGASEENIETSISNLGNVQKKGLFSYFTQTSEGSSRVSSQITSQGSDIIPASGPTFRDLSGGEITEEQHERALAMFAGLDSPIDRILDDSLAGMDTGSIRWDRKPHFKCTCGVERVMRALALLPKEEVQSIVETQEHVEMKCDFCGAQYALTSQEVRNTILQPSPESPPA